MSETINLEEAVNIIIFILIIFWFISWIGRAGTDEDAGIKPEVEMNQFFRSKFTVSMLWLSYIMNILL